MKLTQKQLRSLVSETIKRRLNEEQQVSIADVAGDALCNALIDELENEEGSVVDTAYEMWIGTEGLDNVILPARLEDVEPVAEKLADSVLQDPELRHAVVGALIDMIESAMNSR